VLRTAYRFLPELRAAGQQEALVALFGNTPSATYDQAILSSADDGQWLNHALSWLQPYLHDQEMHKFRSHPAYTPYLALEQGRLRGYKGTHNKIWLSIFDPSPQELESLWLLHLYARYPQDVSSPNPWNADFLDFSWDRDCEVVQNAEHVMEIDLPMIKVKNLFIGRLWKGEVVWSTHWK
jgi:hypothetical protein